MTRLRRALLAGLLSSLVVVVVAAARTYLTTVPFLFLSLASPRRPAVATAAAAADCAAAAEEGGECRAPGDGDDADDPGGHFYAWPTDPPPADDALVHALFPDWTAFQSAWEVHPLLSRVSWRPEPSEATPLPPDRIPTILHNRSAVSKLRSYGRGDGDPLLSIFGVDDAPAVLAQPMKHGDDFKVVKKIVLPPDHAEAGEEYLGMLPMDSMTVNDVLHAFHYGAFSLVINRMQRRWGPIARMARGMEDELGAMGLGVNLYLTPEVAMDEEDVRKHGEARQGFEAHWDWMDVIVVQLSGRKRWSVAREPSVYLSGKDQKQKPSKKHVQSLRHYSEFTLCPGDVLYIPRGHIHNASTVVFDDYEQTDWEGGGADLDRCPSYPKDEASAALSDRLDGPSLHATFGLHQGSEGTIESLLHHALHSYFAHGNSELERAAIRAKKYCPNPAQTASEYDIEWRSVFHHVLAEVSRRDHRCDTLSGIDRGKRATADTTCDGTVVLRKSVPLLLLTKGNRMKESVDDDDDNVRRQYANLRRTYLLALDELASAASLSKTRNFIASKLLKPPSDSELKFHYPGYEERDVIRCPDLLRSLSDETFRKLLQSFREYAKDNFHEALKGLNRWGKDKWETTRRQQRRNLEAVGQWEQLSGNGS